MLWGAIAGAFVASEAANNANAKATGSARVPDSEEISLRELAAEHRRKMDASYRETMRQAHIGGVLLIALAAAIVGCIWQLVGYMVQ